MLDRRSFVVLSLAAALAPRSALAQEKLTMGGLYTDTTDADFSEQAKAFNGIEIALDGFMAPPLKPDATFFVLATEPMAICPFCDSAAQWPQNIVLVYPQGDLRIVNYDQPIVVVGKLDLGVKTDEKTGFVSKVRLVEASFRVKPSVQIGF